MNKARNQPHRLTRMLAFLIGLLVLATYWSYGVLKDAHAAAGQAHLDLDHCRKLAATIEALRHRPVVAGTQEMQMAELTRRIEQAAQSSGMPTENLVRIWPESARRLSESPYTEKPTQITLRQSTLRQLTTFLHHLTTGPDALRASAIRISAPRGQEAGDQWNAEATLSYLIYAPTTTPADSIRK